MGRTGTRTRTRSRRYGSARAFMGENKAVAMAKKAHAAFKAGDIDGVVDCWDENIVHQSHAPTADEPWMGVFKGVEESKKMLAAWGELAPSFSFTEAMFIPVDDTTCLQCMESKLAWLGNYAMSEIKYEWVEETCIEVNPNLCFTFAKSTYPDGTTGVECMRWITTEDGKLVSWTCFGNTVKHAAGGK